MKEYTTPSITGINGNGRTIPAITAIIAGLSIAKAFAAGAALAVGSSLLKKDFVAVDMPGLEPCLD